MTNTRSGILYMHYLCPHTPGFHIKPSEVNFCIQYYDYHNSDSPWLWEVQGTTLPCSLCACKFLGVISKYVVKLSKNLVNCLYMCTYKIPVYLRLFICTYWQVSGIFYSCIIYIFYSQRNRSSGAVTLCKATAYKESKLFPQST